MFIEELNIGVIEFAHGGNLNDYLKHQQQPIGMVNEHLQYLDLFLAWNQRMIWSFQLAEAIAYIHSKGIIHRKYKLRFTY